MAEIQLFHLLPQFDFQENHNDDQRQKLMPTTQNTVLYHTTKQVFRGEDEFTQYPLFRPFFYVFASLRKTTGMRFFVRFFTFLLL